MNLPKPDARLARLFLASLLWLVVTAPSGAQQVEASQSEPPPIPSGTGVVVGQVVHPTDPSRAVGIPVVLYALSSDGQPGLADAVTDERGEFRFEGVSTEPTMAYLAGAKYSGIPFFGPSASFAEGQSEIAVQVDVGDPIRDGASLSVFEVIVQVEWVGSRIAVQELHRVGNNSGSVVLIEDADRVDATPAPFVAQLPVGATDFLPMAMGFEDAFELDDGRVRYWGPIYPGAQDVRFQYLLPARDGDTPIAIRLPMGAEDFSLLTAADGPVIVDTGVLVEDEEIDLDGRGFKVHRTSKLARGAELVFAVGMAVTSDDVSRLTTPRADIWFELDDTQLVASQNVSLNVSGADLLASRSAEPLLRFSLPHGAEILDMSPETRSFGVAIQQNAEATFAEVRGPIPPGESSLRIRYRVQASPDGVSVPLSFPLGVQTLNVLVADLDTGIEIENDRLHRRRPFKERTRMFLHREAFRSRREKSL